MKVPGDNQIEQGARQILDEQINTLDAQTLSRLNRARQTALDEARHAPRARWLPAGLLAGGAALAITFGVGLNSGPPTTPLLNEAAPELALITSDESLDMLSDLEFYLWLDEVLEEG
ncbi:MAG: DUF3619 family protein [Pseudomonadota bacterium]